MLCNSTVMMTGGSFDGQADKIDGNAKVWKVGGLTVEVPDFAEAVKGADLPVYARLKEKGFNAFVVTVTATARQISACLSWRRSERDVPGVCVPSRNLFSEPAASARGQPSLTLRAPKIASGTDISTTHHGPEPQRHHFFNDLASRWACPGGINPPTRRF